MEVLEIFSFIFHFLVLFDAPITISHFSSFSIESSVPFLFNRFVFFRGNQGTTCIIMVWDLEFSRNWGKKWVPTYTRVVACFSTKVQLFPIFKKFLAVIPSIHNHQHLIILNQKINTNTKLPMLLIKLVL